MDEKTFVRYLAEHFKFSHGHGIGDDASVVPSGKTYQLITTDLMVENVHFNVNYFTMAELADKALAVNISDICAMGGKPAYYYLGLGFPATHPETKLFEFFQGLQKANRKWRVQLAGGDFSRSGNLFISITMVGWATRPVYRHTARTNDLICLTGPTGLSALGLKFLTMNIKDEDYFIQRHKNVSIDVRSGEILAKYVNAMIDVSDGLIIDLSRILAASKKGAEIFYEKLPSGAEIKAACRQYGFNEKQLVLGGGEDYVLLFTIPPAEEPKLMRENFSYTVIGKITSEAGKLSIQDQGTRITDFDPGYDHFSTPPSDS